MKKEAMLVLIFLSVCTLAGASEGAAESVDYSWVSSAVDALRVILPSPFGEIVGGIAAIAGAIFGWRKIKAKKSAAAEKK